MASRLRKFGTPGTAYKPFPARAPGIAIITPYWRIYQVSPEDRNVEIHQDDRVSEIDKDDRIAEIEPTSRTVNV